MQIFDAHCDLLYKLWLDPSIDVYSGAGVQSSLQQLFDHSAKIQCFAVFIPDYLPQEEKLPAVLKQISLFHSCILQRFPSIKHITSKKEAENLAEGEIGALLTLEGCGPLGNSVNLAETLYRLGVRSFNLTWNYANYFADGALETRNGGLSELGCRLVDSFNEMKVWTDLSHLSEQSFWDVLERAEYPVASHSNAYKLCPHPRNLNDSQLKALMEKDGAIGVTFVPQFTAGGKPVLHDLLHHVDYICSLGGSMHLGFGSDFDGIEETITGLESYKGYDSLIQELLKRYPESLVERFLYSNFADRLPE
ncbi:dipeptidase [Metabacillus sp. GX 13764]|uniref:dipeptidase n=1 Tax=Metabacillus kandeliae TaxID=2900151 RepID=UPI001E4DFA41|nr:dipeptidase [Metabacillus kandeliae]MCD7033699.1 dipeptidase [Metabacillus kandeliae]